MVRCPVCGSRDVTKLKTGNYRCNSCGLVFYPERDAIVDMRDLIESNDLTPEEIVAVGEKIKDASELIGKKMFGENIRKVFKDMHSIEEVVSQYDENQMVYGVFVDFKGSIKGIFLIIIPEDDALRMMKKYGSDIVTSLKKFGEEAGEYFKTKSSIDVEIGDVYIAYDNISSIMNYLLSEVGENKSLLLNVKFIFENTKEGDMIFALKKESINLLRNII